METSEGAGYEVAVEGPQRQFWRCWGTQGLGASAPGEFFRRRGWGMKRLAQTMRGEKGGRAPRTCNFLSFFSLGDEREWLCFLCLFFFVYFSLFILLFRSFGGQGRRRRGRPTMLGDPDLGQEKSYVKSRRCPMGPSCRMQRFNK